MREAATERGADSATAQQAQMQTQQTHALGLVDRR